MVDGWMGGYLAAAPLQGNNLKPLSAMGYCCRRLGLFSPAVVVLPIVRVY